MTSIYTSVLMVAGDEDHTQCQVCCQRLKETMFKAVPKTYYVPCNCPCWLLCCDRGLTTGAQSPTFRRQFIKIVQTSQLSLSFLVITAFPPFYLGIHRKPNVRGRKCRFPALDAAGPAGFSHTLASPAPSFKGLVF